MATTKQRNQVPKGSHGGMQLVLTEDVPNLGRQGDVVEVKGGYGRNYLLPRGLATVPTRRISLKSGHRKPIARSDGRSTLLPDQR